MSPSTSDHPRAPLLSRESVTAEIVTATVLGIGSLILQRWVAETRGAAIALVIAWFALVTLGVAAYVRNRPRLRVAALGTVGVIAVATIVIGYWTGFRDREVDENVAVAEAAASKQERKAGLAGQTGSGSADAAEASGEPRGGPVSLATGMFSGQDGHAGMATAEVIRSPAGDRSLTFTDFDVDPGAAVEVYLTPDVASVDDRVELGGLKGNVGDQQYEIPDDADLSTYDSVVLWCTPFTVRIATAELG